MIVTKKFTKEFLIALMNGDFDSHIKCNIVDDELVDTSRWSNHHLLTFECDGTLYQVPYSVGATEQQDESPFENGPDQIRCCEVKKVPVTTFEYQVVKITQ